MFCGGSPKNLTFRGGRGFTKKQYRGGELPKKGDWTVRFKRAENFTGFQKQKLGLQNHSRTSNYNIPYTSQIQLLFYNDSLRPKILSQSRHKGRQEKHVLELNSTKAYQA